MSGWFSWWESSSKPDPLKAKQGSQEWQLGSPGSLGENPSLKEPLGDIPEASSEEEETVATETAMENEKRRRVREIRAYKAEPDDDKKSRVREIQEYVAENRQDVDTLWSMSSDTFSTRDAYKVARENLSTSYDSGDDTTNTGTVSGSAGTPDEDEDEEIDYEAVEQYDQAFNEFIAANPEFVVVNPDLVQSLRVCKLQKLLERGSTIETELSYLYEKLQRDKLVTEIHYQKELTDASRKKAAESISLASKLTATKKATDEMEAKLLWKLFTTYEFNAKKQHRLREQLKQTTEGTNHRWNLMGALPRSKECQSIRDAMLAPPSFRQEPLSKEQENDVMQFQIDNAMLLAEIAMLQKKLSQVKALAKKNEWVESMLIRMHPKVLRKLKTKYEKTKEVSL